MMLPPELNDGGAVISGKKIARAVHERVKARIDALLERGERPPRIALILVGEDHASQIYVRNKTRTCRKVGIDFMDAKLPDTTPGEALLQRIAALNHDPAVDGILVQLPLPEPIREFEARVMAAVSPSKDVDGFHPENVGKLLLGRPSFVPCTPLGILEMLDHVGAELEGAEAVVIGRSPTVGKPVAALLLQRHATVTMCHSRTRDLAAQVARADVLVAAVGRPQLIRGAWIKPGAIVIDVGINRTESGLVGDVEFEAARARASHITPVPGGVGPMTVAMLMQNTLQARLAHGPRCDGSRPTAQAQV